MAPSKEDSPEVGLADPPMPVWLTKNVLNPAVKLLLRSPLHRLASDDLALLTFQGRKSGDTYTVPVGYEELEDGIYVTTHHTEWWRNFRGGAEVELLLRGEERTGRATLIESPSEVADYLEGYVERHSLQDAGRVGLEVQGEGRPSRESIEGVAEEIYVVRIELDR